MDDQEQCLTGAPRIPEQDMQRNKKTLLESLQKNPFEGSRQLLLFLNSDTLGNDPVLGEKLLNQLLEASASGETLPQTIILTGTSVKLACTGKQALSSLCHMEALGTEILVEKESLKYFSLTNSLCCGTETNIKQIWAAFMQTDKIISF